MIWGSVTPWHVKVWKPLVQTFYSSSKCRPSASAARGAPPPSLRHCVESCILSTNWTVTFTVFTLLTKLLFKRSTDMACDAYDNNEITDNLDRLYAPTEYFLGPITCVTLISCPRLRQPPISATIFSVRKLEWCSHQVMKTLMMCSVVSTRHQCNKQTDRRTYMRDNEYIDINQSINQSISQSAFCSSASLGKTDNRNIQGGAE